MWRRWPTIENEDVLDSTPLRNGCQENAGEIFKLSTQVRLGHTEQVHWKASTALQNHKLLENSDQEVAPSSAERQAE